MAVGRGLRLVEHGVFGIELTDRRDAPSGVALAKHPRKVGLHQAVIVDERIRRLIDHLPPSGIRGSGRASLIKHSIRFCSPVRSTDH
jgi:hypothetical protein